MILKIALLSLWQHKRRTFFLGVAISLVTALLLVMLGVTEGMRRSLVEASTTLMSGHVNVAGFFKVTSGQAAPVVLHSEEIREVVKKEVPELTYIAKRGRGWARLVSETSSKMLGLAGVEIAEEQGLQKILQIKEGRLEDLAKPGAILLFEDQASDLEVKVGDALTLSAPTPRGVSNTLEVTVVAVARNLGMMSQFSAFLNDATLRRLYQLNDDTTGALQIYLPSAELPYVKTVQARLRDALGKAGYQLMDEDPRVFFMKFENVQREAWVGQRLDITNWHDEVSFSSWTVDLMSALSFFLAVVLLQVVGVGIMIVMWMSIRERTREIGTLRAIGMQRRTVLLMFLTEGAMLGALSTAAGVALGLGASLALNAAALRLPLGLQFVLLSEKLLIVPTAQWALGTTVFITAAVTVFAVIPSIVAARLRPVTAMAHVS
jgi:ABC-type lipoprotein release transport system permease subunit